MDEKYEQSEIPEFLIKGLQQSHYNKKYECRIPVCEILPPRKMGLLVYCLQNNKLMICTDEWINLC